MMNIIYLILIPTLSFIAFLGNLLTIIAFWKETKLREKPSDALILALACIDFVTGLIVLPLNGPLYITPGHWPLEEIGCRILISSAVAVQTISLFLLIGISLDRYLLVSLEYSKYVKLQSKRRIKGYIVITLAISIIAIFIEQAMWNYGKTINEVAAGINFNRVCLSPIRRVATFSTFYFLLFFFLPVVMVCGLSIAFLMLLRRRIKKKARVGVSTQSRPDQRSTASATPATEETSDGQGTSDASVRNRYIKPALTLIALVSAMALCMLPYCLYVIVVEWFCSECRNVPVLYAVLLLQFSNACLDPILYAATQSKIRRYYQARLKSICRN